MSEDEWIEKQCHDAMHAKWTVMDADIHTYHAAEVRAFDLLCEVVVDGKPVTDEDPDVSGKWFAGVKKYGKAWPLREYELREK